MNKKYIAVLDSDKYYKKNKKLYDSNLSNIHIFTINDDDMLVERIVNAINMDGFTANEIRETQSIDYEEGIRIYVKAMSKNIPIHLLQLAA